MHGLGQRYHARRQQRAAAGTEQLKIDMAVAAVDYAAYESKLQHRNAQRGRVNRVYVQLHNRGIAASLALASCFHH